MKRIIDISEEDYNHLCFVDENTIFNIVEISTPLNECEPEDIQKYINALRKCAKEHEKDFVPTFNIRTSDLCNDTADLLQKLSILPKCESEDYHRQNIKAYAHDMGVSEEQAEKELRVKGKVNDCISRQKVIGLLNGLSTGADKAMKDHNEVAMKLVDDMPSIFPENDNPRGEWIDLGYLYHHYYNDGDIETTKLRCSRCNEEVEWDIDLARKPRFCSNCGARMVEKQGEDK